MLSRCGEVIMIFQITQWYSYKRRDMNLFRANKAKLGIRYPKDVE